MLIVPMVAGGELVGTLGSIRTSSSAPYSTDDLRLLEALGERAALAIADTMATPRKIGAEDYQALFRYSVDGLLITAPDGQILAANPAMCDMVGMTERELIDAGRDAVVVATDPRLGPALEERAAAGRARSLLTLRRGDGSTFEAEVTSTIYATGDGRARTCMIIRAVEEERGDEEPARCSSER